MYRKELMAHVITTGPDPEKHCVAQIVLWPHISPVFGEKSFIQTVTPPKWREIDIDYVNSIGYEWTYTSCWNPIYRESVSTDGTWIDIVKFTKSIYGKMSSNIYLTGVSNGNFISSQVVLAFVYGIYKDYIKVKKETNEYVWPFK